MKLLLLVQSPDDVQHLNAAAQSILNSSITGVWVVFSPAITIDASEAATKLDTEIEQLRSAERAAAERSDYTAAAGYKTQREGKELDRAAALRNAWKTADEAKRKERTRAIFEPFVKTLDEKKISVKVTGHSDHYERDQWVALLNSLTGVWFKPFTPGSFVVGWPESVETSIRADKMRWAELAKAGEEVVPSLPEKITPPSKPKTREEELLATHHMSLRPIAKKLGLDIEGKSKVESVAMILTAEAAPAPEPVEAY